MIPKSSEQFASCFILHITSQHTGRGAASRPRETTSTNLTTQRGDAGLWRG